MSISLFGGSRRRSFEKWAFLLLSPFISSHAHPISPFSHSSSSSSSSFFLPPYSQSEWVRRGHFLLDHLLSKEELYSPCVVVVPIDTGGGGAFRRRRRYWRGRMINNITIIMAFSTRPWSQSGMHYGERRSRRTEEGSIALTGCEKREGGEGLESHLITVIKREEAAANAFASSGGALICSAARKLFPIPPYYSSSLLYSLVFCPQASHVARR